MLTISICATKGGAGKSTLATLLAVHVQHATGEPVAMIDLDGGQGSTTAWSTVRARNKLNGPELVQVRSLGADLRRLAHRGVAYAFIDTPPTLDDAGIVERAIEIADYVLSPCRPSIFDIGAAETIDEIAGDTPLGFVLTDVTTGSKWEDYNAKMAKALAGVGHVFEHPLTHRLSYTNNIAAGRTGAETDATAAREVAALWREVSEWMK